MFYQDFKWDFIAFQVLIGRLKTRVLRIALEQGFAFQVLIGRLKTSVVVNVGKWVIIGFKSL